MTLTLGALVGPAAEDQRSDKCADFGGNGDLRRVGNRGCGQCDRGGGGRDVGRHGHGILLNAAALYIFPPLGHAMHLTQTQFGTWAGIAIHDVSSVVGAAARYGPSALQTATAVKLSRALWIVPVAFGAAVLFRGAGGEKRGSVQIPWFIGLFLLASVSRSFVPGSAALGPVIASLATHGLTMTLFLIGAGISARTLQSVGWRPLVQGVMLWFVISVGSLGVILAAVR